MNRAEVSRAGGVLPIIESDIFKDEMESQFATIDLGYGMYPNGVEPAVFNGYLRFRKDVYSDEGILSLDGLDDAGIEHDEDDNRAEHFIVAENRGLGGVAIVACMRLIEKNNGDPLPIERFYPEVFGFSPSPQGSVEVSRFISRADGIINMLNCVRRLFKDALRYYDEQRFPGPAYGVVEEDLEKALIKFGAPSTRIADIKRIELYNSDNVGIEIDVDFMREQMGRLAVESAISATPRIDFWGRKRS